MKKWQKCFALNVKVNFWVRAAYEIFDPFVLKLFGIFGILKRIYSKIKMERWAI